MAVVFSFLKNKQRNPLYKKFSKRLICEIRMFETALKTLGRENLDKYPHSTQPTRWTSGAVNRVSDLSYIQMLQFWVAPLRKIP